MMTVARETPLKLAIRYWRQYPYNEPLGQIDEPWEFLPREAGFLPLHLWNVGMAGGPPAPADRFAVGMASSTPGLLDLEKEVIDKYITPCLYAARNAGITVLHIEPDLIANKYPISNIDWKATDIPPYPEKWGNLPVDDDAEGPQSLAREEDPEANWTDAIPGWSKKRAEMVHGEGYREWDGYQTMDIVEPCKPIEGEYVVKTTQQLDRICRRLGIVNLIYVGFSTQGCVLFSPGAIADMSLRGYRCLLIREATLGEEYPDTIDERLVTKLSIRLVEWKFGLTIGADDFIRGCKVVARSKK